MLLETSMVVRMVKVGRMGMLVRDLGVFVDVAVRFRNALAVYMGVVFVVMAVFVFVA